MQAPILQAKDLRYCAGGATLIDIRDLAIQPGRRTVVLGANGAGKSLLLRLLHGLIQPGGGEVLWRGGQLDRAARRKQAMVFQRPVMLRRSVRANLRFALAIRGLGKTEAATRTARALQQARLEDVARRPARVLSGGEQQRLAIARAMATEPDVLFLDEPCASLDPASTQAIEAQINSAHRDGVTVIMVTHDIGQARRIADDVIFLHKGRVSEAGPAAHVLSAPQSAAAQAWMDGRLLV